MGDQIRVGITTGDLNGVGMETIIKVFMDQRMLEGITPIIYGNGETVKAYRKAAGLTEFQFQAMESADEANAKTINVVNVWNERFSVELGVASSASGKLAFESLKSAVEDLASNKIDVLVTAPINKDTIQSDEFNFPGHTEYLSNMSNVEDSLMFLVDEGLRVGVATGHIPLKEISEKLTKEIILSKLALMQESLERDFGIPNPKIAVLGLNPHAGDNGLLGSEEKEIIAPAISTAQESGILAYGSYGADGFFGAAAFKKFDAVLAMYHDQGLIPFKTLAFENGVNYTAGLPIVRTSPDHGTAYDIAGKGLVNEGSMRHAIFLACDIYNNRKTHKEITANPLKIRKKERKDE